MKRTSIFALCLGLMVAGLASHLWAQDFILDIWKVREVYFIQAKAPSQAQMAKLAAGNENIPTLKVKAFGPLVRKTGAAQDIRLAGLEKHIETIYLPWMQNYGMPEPLIYPSIKQDSAEARKWALYVGTEVKSAGLYDVKCSSSLPSEQKYPFLAFNKKLVTQKKFGSFEEAEGALITSHEIVHAIMFNDERHCFAPFWVREGVADALALHIFFTKEPSEITDHDPILFNKNAYYGLRGYTYPLDLGPDAKSVIASKLVEGVSIEDTLEFSQYASSSFFRYMMEGTKESQIVNDFAHVTSRSNLSNQWLKEVSYANRPIYYNIIRDRFRQEEINLGSVLAGFYTEYGSYGFGRYKKLPIGKAGEQDLRRFWLDYAFGCKPKDDISFAAGQKQAYAKIPIKKIYQMAGRCVVVKWEKLENVAPLTFKFSVDTLEKAKALRLGVSFVEGAPSAYPAGEKNTYCYAALTGGGGKNGLPVINNRMLKPYTDKCLLLPKIFRNKKTDKYDVIFATKFMAGQEAGSAEFVLTNAPAKMASAPKKAEDRVTTFKGWVSLTSVKGLKLSKENTIQPKTVLITNNAFDVYYNHAIGMVGDYRGAPGSGQANGGSGKMQIDSGATGRELSTSSIIGDDFTVLFSEDKESNLIAVVSSVDGKYFGFSEPDDCYKDNGVEIIFEEEVGLAYRLKVAMLDFSKLLSIAMAEPDLEDCELKNRAKWRDVELDVFLPHGGMHRVADAEAMEPLLVPERELVLSLQDQPFLPDLGGLPIAPPFSSGANGEANGRGAEGDSPSGASGLPQGFGICFDENGPEGEEQDRRRCLEKLLTDDLPDEEEEEGRDLPDMPDMPDTDFPPLVDPGAQSGSVSNNPGFEAYLAQIKALTPDSGCACTCQTKRGLEQALEGFDEELERMFSVDPTQSMAILPVLDGAVTRVEQCYLRCETTFAACG